MRNRETGLKRVWIGICAFWIGFIIFPLAAIWIFFEVIASKIFEVLWDLVWGLFSPLNVTHGDTGCCAECTFKREDELEVVYDEEDTISGGND